MAINYIYDNTLGKHFDNTGNLRAAERQGLISEPQYKTMSGYDASQTIPGITDNPLVTGATSGAYNIAKSIFSPEDYFDQNTYQKKIGPIDSTLLNIQGSVGLSPEDKEKYEGIVSLDPKSLGMGAWDEEDLTDFSGVYDDDEYDFSDIEGQMAFLDPASIYALLKAGTSKKKIGQYLLKNQILKQTGKKIGPDLRRKIRQTQGEKFGGSGIFKNIATGSKDYGPYTKPPIKPYVAPPGPHSADPPSGNGGGSGSGVAAGTGASGPPGRNYKKVGGRASYFDGGLLSLWPR